MIWGTIVIVALNVTMIHIVGRTRPGNKNKLEKKNEFITNRPFYGCRLSDLTINWKGPHTINAANSIYKRSDQLKKCTKTIDCKELLT